MKCNTYEYASNKYRMCNTNQLSFLNSVRGLLNFVLRKHKRSGIEVKAEYYKLCILKCFAGFFVYSQG